MKNYEITFVVAGNLTSEAADKAFDDVKSKIKDLGGAITNEKRWGSRRLAYKIQKNEQGFYYTLNFDFEGKGFSALEKYLLFEKEVIRHLITESYTNIKTVSFHKDSKTSRKTTKSQKPVADKEREQQLEKALEKILEE